MNEQKDADIDISTNVSEEPQVYNLEHTFVDGQARPVEQERDDQNNASLIGNESENKEKNVFKYDFSEYCNITNGEKSEKSSNSHCNTLQRDLYDGEIAEIYIGESIGSMDNAKYSGGSDSNLSEMTSSFGPVEYTEANPQENGVYQQKTQEIPVNSKNREDVQEDKILLNKQSNNSADPKKRPLSPSFTEDEHFDIKRIKSEPIAYPNGICGVNKSSNSEAVVDLCPPVAVVAPLGFCEDIVIDDTLKTPKGEPDYIKNDISSILDSLEQGDDNASNLFDAVFEKMKSDIIAGHSFKTSDGNNWTFDGKSTNGKHHSKSVQSEISDEKHTLKTENKNSVKSEFKRTNSVEHDIEDFEKVLNSVIAKANRIPKDSESLGQECGRIKPGSDMQNSLPNKQCQQPCNHVANSDLLRELLDQKTESNDKQTKARQEIDLSFLHSDLVSGKGLSVSSDKILQTRTIDPRLTSIPHVEKASSMNQTKVFKDESRANIPNYTKSLEDDYMSLAEQRRASVTLHHKVPSLSSHMAPHVGGSSEDNGAYGGSNIIKEAFDFATEISDCPSYENDTALLQPCRPVQTESRQQGFTNGSFFSSPKNESYLNRNNLNHTLKVDLAQNNQVFRNTHMQDMHHGNGLLTFANPNGIQSPETSLPPQLTGPFMNAAENSVSGQQAVRKQTHNNQMFSKNAETMSVHSNRSVTVKNETQQFTPQNPNMVHANPMKHLAISQMDSLQNSGLAHRQNRSYVTQNTSTGYPMTNVAYNGHMSRNGMADFRLGSEEKTPNFRYESGHPMSHMNRTFLSSEKNFPMGMQERIRAMNVQQWYRRRMQAQMNRPVNPHSQQAMRHPMVQGQNMGSHQMLQGQGMGSHPMAQGQGMGSHPVMQGQGMASHAMAHGQGMGSHPMAQAQGIGSHPMSRGQGMGLQPNTIGIGPRIKPSEMHQELGSLSHSGIQGQDIDPRLRAMQTQIGQANNLNASGNLKMHQNSFSQGQGQISLENQSHGHMQYRQHMSQQARTPDAELLNPMQLPKPFSADSFLDNTSSNTAHVSQQDTFNSQPAQDLFPFDV